MREFQLPKEGRVTTFTIIRYPPLGFEDLTPYAVGLIDFDGGHRIIGRIGGDINHLAIGQPVTFVRVVNSAFEFTL